MANRSKRTTKADTVYFETLSLHANVTSAAEAAGYPRRSVYEWKEKDKAFHDEWERAWLLGVDGLEDEVARRAAEGVLEPVFHRGEIVAHVRKFSDTLLMFMLRGRRPKTFRDNSSVEHAGQVDAPLDFTVNFVSPKKDVD